MIRHRILLLTLGILVITPTLMSQEITLGCWNVEHLGSPGRGLGYRSLPLRREDQLNSLARFISSMEPAVLALQEIAITGYQDEIPRNEAMEYIIQLLGSQWQYAICANPRGPVSENSVHNMQNAYLWDSSRVLLEDIFPLPVRSVQVGGKNTFDRTPYAAWFSSLHRGDRGNDFLMINLHLASGQDNDENHLVAMVMVEQSINQALRDRDITESDRIILGDFNDDPWSLDHRGRLEHMDLLYQYMSHKRYENLLSQQWPMTRMNNQLDSRIDHVLINSSALRHYQDDSFRVVIPPGETLEDFQQWRDTYSDHFPLLFQLKVGSDDDSD